MNAFHVIGSIAAIWAVVLASFGIWGNEDFPRGGREKIVGAISVLIVVGAISAAILTGGSEGEAHGGGGGGDAAAEGESH